MPKYIWPVPRGTSVNQPFGSSPGGVNPGGGHTGTDLGVKAGTPLRAPADGVIEYAQWFKTDDGSDNPYWLTSGGGISVVLGCDGDDAPSFVFSHLDYTEANPGDRVQQGDVIGYSGNTGKWTTGAHLHFEAIPPGYNLNSPTYGRVDPARYCTGYWSGTTTLGDKITPIQPSTEEGTLMALSDNEQKELLALARQIAGYTDMKTSEVPRKVWGWNPHNDRTDTHGRLTELWRDYIQGVPGRNSDGDSFSVIRSILAAVKGKPIDETARRKKVTGK